MQPSIRKTVRDVPWPSNSIFRYTVYTRCMHRNAPYRGVLQEKWKEKLIT
uniref:Uncharacterized protein n=1 Tax=Rhizophora mucronata TaxID=61149 RepID=A0A2P2QZT9_RHIMU